MNTGRSRSRFRQFLAILVGFWAVSPALEGAEPVSFVREIAPILAVHCQGCHHPGKAAMGLDLTTFEGLKKGGKQSGPDEMIVAGKPEDSRLVEVIEAEAEPRMPYKLRPLPESSITLIARWIAEGAKFDGPDSKLPLIALIDPAIALKIQAAQGESATKRPATAGSESAARVAALSPDGMIVAIDRGHYVDIYETSKAAEPKTTLGPVTGTVSGIVFSKDGKAIFVAHGRPGIDGYLAGFEISNAAKSFDLRVHDDQVLGLAVSPDGKSLATASYDRSAIVVDISARKIATRLVEHTDSVYDVAFSPTDSNLLATASADRSVKLWDIKAGKRIETLSDANGELFTIGFLPDGKTIVGGGADRTLRAWDIAATPPKLIRSTLAHEGPIVRLAVKPGKTGADTEILTIAEDRSVKRWAGASFEPVGTARKFEEWPASVSIAGNKLAVAELSGAIWLLDASKPEATATWIRPAKSTRGGPPDSFKPRLVRIADLGRPSPPYVSAGEKVTVTLSGQGVGDASKVWVAPVDVKFELKPHDPPQPNSIQLVLDIPPRPGTDSIRVRLMTPLGVTGEQSILVNPGAVVELPSRMPGDPAELPELKPGQIYRTTIAAPGQQFSGRLKSARGETLTVRSIGRLAGSSLTERLRFETPDGRLLASCETQPGRDTVLNFRNETSGDIVLKLTDASTSGGGNHIALLEISSRPVVSYHWPPAMAPGEPANLVWNSNDGRSSIANSPIPASEKPAEQRLTSVGPPAGWMADRSRSILAVPGRTIRTGPESEPVRPGDAAIGLFGSARAYHEFRFEAKAGERLIIETWARRLGYDSDTIIEVTDAEHRPVVLARFRMVADTLVDFRDHTSRQKTIRLTRWPEFRMSDYVLIGREIARIHTLPKNPDDDCQFYGDELRWGYFGTTPEQVPQGRTVTRLELLPPGDSKSVDPASLHEAFAINDDGGLTVGNDSYLEFVPPADGIYHVAVRETRGRFGPNFGYALTVRKPRPDFELQFGPIDWNVPAGGNRVVTATVRRRDGFEGPVDLHFEGLSKHFRATSGRIEPGQLSTDLLIEHDSSTTGELDPSATWKLIATASIDGETRTRTIDGASSKWAITPKSNLTVTTSTNHVKLVPGEIVEMRLKVDRSDAFSGRVPVDVRNLPYGVRVLDIGLNGVLITEKETERTIRIFAEEWVPPQTRPFFAVGRAESAGTSDSAPPVMLEIVPRESGRITAAAGAAR
jgi:WD40 repeat protein